MIVERSPTSRTPCSCCGESIEKGTLRVVERSQSRITQYFHLGCFCPEKKVPYTVNSFYCRTDCQGAVAQWVKNWNKQFITRESDVPQQYLAQTVSTVPTAARRRLIETFAFLTVGEVETTAALTCKEWFHVTRDQELWKSCFLQQFNPTSTEADGDYRRKYIAYYLSACVGCKKREQVYKKCELSERLICKECASLPAFRITSLHSFSKATCVTPATLKLLQVPEFLRSGVKSSYARHLLQKVQPYASRRLGKLLSMLEHCEGVREEELRELQALDIAALYRKPLETYFPQIVKIKPIAKLVLAFCGKCEKGEEKSFQEFVSGLEEIRSREK